jgi:hypothetical protein
MEQQELEKICKIARWEGLTRGYAIFCDGKCSGKNPEIPFPGIHQGDLCVATILYRHKGYSNPDVINSLDKMYECKNRKQ